jgi:diguanylate cyclase (GGDEF)-like protein
MASALNSAFDRADASGRPMSLLYLGVDEFADLNNAYGHELGDALLVELARRLIDHAPLRHMVSRWAGDEFLLVMNGDVEDARPAAARLLDVLSRPFQVGGTEMAVSASLGIACYPRHGARHLMVGNAVTAMRAAKAHGGGAYTEYDARMGVDVREQQELAHDLRGAVQRGELELVYQPKVDARSLQVTAAEALLRWHHPRHGIVSPSLFIPIAERHRLIGDIGNWVLEEAARQAGVWRDAGLRMRVAFNVSAYQMRQDDFADRLAAALKANRLQPSRFTCEITETVAMEDTRVTQEAFERLRKLGVHISIDDFGTGHSSLSLLRRLPAAELKIDRSFVADIATSAEARSIVTAVVQVARALNLRVVAEGVEKPDQVNKLVMLGCDELQGFLFARPMSARSLGLWASDVKTPEALAFRASLFRETVIKQPT